MEEGTVPKMRAGGARPRLDDDLSPEACADAPLVVEAVIEDLEVQRRVFADLEAVVGRETVLATNTSSLSVAGIAAATERPERVVGMHFFNPVPAMRLVEIVGGPSTDPLGGAPGRGGRRAAGKDPDSGLRHAGLIVNRVARPFYLEALRLVEEGVVPGRIDAAIRGAGFRMGPPELADLIGHDVNLAVSESLFERYYYQPRFRPRTSSARWSRPGCSGERAGGASTTMVPKNRRK